MYNPSNVHAFFERLSASASSVAPAAKTEKPAFEMLHSSSKPARTGYIEGSLQEAMMSTAAQNPPCFFETTVLNDFGVGLPPLS